ncbi:MAG: DUF2007 domain-containing protein [Bacteroidales bacterium]|jgi:hypothetical protein|nr:DUF2007 domain-containing protein [Bacteroidales bacterium]
MDKLVTVFSAPHLHEIGIPQSLLESEGIKCFIKNEMIGALYSGVIGNIQLQVSADDAPKAIEILANGGFSYE